MPSPKNKQQAPDTLIKVGSQGTIYQQKTYQASERAYGSTQEISEEYEEVIIDRSAAEIIDQINKRVKSPYYSLCPGILVVVFLFIFPPLSILLLVVTYIIYREDIKRKTTPLFYEFSDDYSENKFNDSIASFCKLATAKRIWRLKSKVTVGDWKRNAGSNSALIRHHAAIGKHNPNLLKTNVEVWGIDAGSIKLYLLPDRFFIFQDGVYSAVSYSEVQTSLEEIEYVEQESLPNDAAIIGKTWKYIRRDGGPDRRFNNNRQLPIVKYGVIAISSPSFIAYLIVSSFGIASSFTKSFARILTSSTTGNKSLPISNTKFQSAVPETDVCSEYLEPLLKAASQRSELTTNQIAKLLGISASVITKNPVSFDYERFRFIRSGRSGRQISWKVECLS